MSTDWKGKIGEVHGNKQIIEFVEIKRFRHGGSKAMFRWQCLRCLKVQGPSQYGDIKRYPKSNCCAMARDTSRYGYREISGARMRWMQCGAKKRGLDFTVSSEYLWDLYLNQNRTCPTCARPT